MKSFTDIEQSKKLAEILPLESADMFYEEVCNLPKAIVGNYILHNQCMEDRDYKKLSNPVLSPAWSLAALLEQLDDEITDDNGNDYNLTIVKESLQYQLYYHDSWGQVEDIETNYYDDLVDACYEMIINLHEQKLL